MKTNSDMLIKIIDCANRNDRPDIVNFAQQELESIQMHNNDLREVTDLSVRKEMFYEIVDFADEYKDFSIKNYALKQLGRMRREAKSKTITSFIW